MQTSSRNDVIGIVGAGLMGRGIAQITAQAGFEVRLIDVKADAATQAKRAVAEMLASLAAKDKITAEAAEAAAGRILLPSALAELAGCSIVIEAIVERLDAKQALFASLEPMVGDACILVTNTSSLSVTAIASACHRPERVAGLHFFSPVPLMKIAEAIGGLKTAPEVVTRLVEFAGTLGHTPVRAKDTPGFIVNHAGRGYGTEALRIVGEGIADYATIDRILKLSAGFRMGPFELFDLTGLDVSHPAMESIYRQFYEEPRFRPSPLTGQRLAAGVLGRKSGHGFYDYTGEAQAPPLATPRSDPARSVWISSERPDAREAVAARILELGCRVDACATAAADSLCLVLPLGRDATTAALDEGLDPRRTLALDTFLGIAKHCTLMTTPLTDHKHREAARALFESGGSTVDVIHDSPGFVAQRVLAHIVNIACDIAQQGIATPPDIDLAVKLGLAYPRGPLEWGDALGPLRVLQILQQLHRAYGDPRYRPSIWLARRARLGVSLLVPDG